MKVLFILCEGPHDAQFISRLLIESKEFTTYREQVKDYPSPLNDFIKNRFATGDISAIRLDKPPSSLVPIGAFYHEKLQLLVLPLALGGMTQFELGKTLLNELKNSFDPDVLAVEKSSIDSIAALFIYDADSRGVEKTVEWFLNQYGKVFLPAQQTIETKQWYDSDVLKLALFILTDKNLTTGTLENILLDLFQIKDTELLSAAQNFVHKNFKEKSSKADEVAYLAKQNKAILNCSGQIESPGASLSVVIRDTQLLKNAFDFSVRESQWTQLLELIQAV